MRYKEERKRRFKRKHEEHNEKKSIRVNAPQMIQAEMSKVKVGLANLFKTEINQIMREFKPRTDNSEDWQAFEGAYEEALHLLRLHVVKALKRDEKKMCRFRKVNPRMQKARA
jgi:hypothetical protein